MVMRPLWEWKTIGSSPVTLIVWLLLGAAYIYILDA